jgi:N-acetylglucosaminyldiphosphoundecaprenol N-acetyl-beta-D-mannosaminyltransferase
MPMTKARQSAARIQFAGLSFSGLRAADLLPEAGQFKFIVTVNADFVVTSCSNERFRQIISNNLSTFDGQITWWLARLLGTPKSTPFEKISGSSFAHDLLEDAAARGLRVFFLGALPHVNEAAVRAVQTRYGVEVAGYSPPLSAYPAQSAWSDEILRRVRAQAPQVVFVALGAPKQEFWIDDHRDALQDAGVQLVIGCGGTLDFLSGEVPRAPRWVQQSGLEGVYRLLMQPSLFRLKRLARSLLVIPIAFWKAVS